jgi:cytochrome c556
MKFESIVVALLLTAVSTGAFAREFYASDPQFGRHPIDTFHARSLGAETGALEHIWTGASGFSRSKSALIGATSPLLAGRLRGVERI